MKYLVDVVLTYLVLCKAVLSMGEHGDEQDKAHSLMELLFCSGRKAINMNKLSILTKNDMNGKGVTVSLLPSKHYSELTFEFRLKC